MKTCAMSLLLCLGCAPPIATQAPPGQPPAPPTVLAGHARLDCSISSRANGQQKLTLDKGAGLSFEAEVSPIVDGIIELKGAEQGGEYGFTSHLAKPARGKLTGVGDVTLDTLDTRVHVTVSRYQQQGGPGKTFFFGDRDLVGSGAYIEFVGQAHADNGDRYSFRVTLAEPSSGRGEVTPDGPNNRAPIYAKTVVVEAPVTTVTTSTTVQRLR